MLERSSIFVLIPPNAALSDAVVYENKALGSYDVLRALSNGEEEGWLSILYPDFHDLGAAEQFDLFQSELDAMQDFLWDSFGEWLQSQLPSSDQPEDILFIPSGALQFLPLSLAADFDEYLIDVANISTNSSVYSFFLMSQRAAFQAPEKNELCFVKGFEGASAGQGYSGIDSESDLIRGHLASSITHVDMSQSALEELKASVEPCNLWHFSAHSKFNFGAQRFSNITLGDMVIPRSLISVFEPQCPIRCIFFASCESGLIDFMSKDADLEGFLENAMELGAMSSVGVQWQQPDRSTPLISSQFYFNLIKQKQSPTLALANAQRWVRDATASDIIAFLDQLDSTGVVEAVSSYRDYFLGGDENYRPFEPPQYWAGFTLRGI